MSNTNFEDRKASAENTALWMMAEIHRAQNDAKDKTSIVNTADLIEVLSYVASIKERSRIEYAGKPLGFCRPHELRQMLNRDITRMLVISKKTRRFNTLVSFTEIGIDTWSEEAQNMPKDSDGIPLGKPLPELEC